MTANAQRRRLEVSADLTISHELGDVLVTGHAGRMTIDLPGLAMGRELTRTGLGQVGTAGMRTFDNALRGAGLTMDVRIRNRRVGRLGSGVRPGVIDRLLGRGPLKLDYFNIIRSILPG
jgi:hypothetical protein